MNTFIVTITETLVRTVPVPGARSEDEALEIIERQYKNEKIVLDAGDFEDVGYSVEKLEEDLSC